MRKSGYFLGADIGGTRTRLLIADETGRVVGFGQAGPGNHEVVGYDGLVKALKSAYSQAVTPEISIERIAGAGFGVGGYDFASETGDTLAAIAQLGLNCPVTAVNDTIIGLVAGSPEGWGIAVVSGTGCNCWGWDKTRQRIGRVTGHGLRMGEGAGASEIVDKAIQAVAHEWTKRGPATQLTPAFLRITGAKNIEELIEGLISEDLSLDASAAPLIFEVASRGDQVATGLIHWAGRELGELANCVIRQLDIQALEFDVVLVGSMFGGGPMLVEPMASAIHAFAPRARLVRLADPPVIGAVLLGMEAAGLEELDPVRERLSQSLVAIHS